jgi:uncharacterized membrane protein
VDILKDNSKDNYLISKFNYLIFNLITISFFTNFCNNFFFLVIISFLFLTHQHYMEKQINMCLFISVKFLLIEIKFEVDINNDELLKTISKHKKKKS